MLPYVDKGKCPSHKNLECFDHGVSTRFIIVKIFFDRISRMKIACFTIHLQVCSNLDTCICDKGWTGTDCSIQELLPTTTPPPVVETTTLSANETDKKSSLESQMVMKETPYGNKNDSNFPEVFTISSI